MVDSGIKELETKNWIKPDLLMKTAKFIKILVSKNTEKEEEYLSKQ